MSLFKPSTWGISKVYRDIMNYRDWIRIIKRESLDKNSKFNKWKLSHNIFYTVYFTQDIEDTESQLPERIMQLRLMESMAPLHRYLDEELGFAECLTPSFNRFYDDENNPTLTFLITYRFSFNKLSIGWILKWIFLISVGFIIVKLGWINKLIEWGTTLI